MNRTTLNVQQGTDAWLSARAACDGTASEAPAMFGKSKYQTRTELLAQRKTGLVKTVDGATQAIFAKGHEAEASARKLAEHIIGDELSPVTYMIEIDGLKLIASLDGITFDDSIIWEHKLWSEKLAEQVENEQLDEHYTIQLDQELLASGATKCLFMVSDGTADKCVSMWYESNAKKAQALVDGWKQFKTDLAGFVPPTIVEKVEAETIQTLPVPSVVVRGEITTSNLDEITPLFDKYLGSVKSELSTDQDFADAEANAKNCRETAARIKSLRANIIAQMVDVNTVDSILTNYEEAFNKVGLRLEKAVKEQKETIKTNAILKTRQDYFSHVQVLETEIAPIRLNLAQPDFAKAISGVKSMATMHSRLNDALAAGKIEADALARDIRIKLIWYHEFVGEYKYLFDGISQMIIYKPMDDFKLLVESKIAAHKHLEAEKEAKIKADAEAAARAKVESEKSEAARIVAMVAAAATLPTMSNEEVKKHISQINIAEPIRIINKETRPTDDQIIEVIALHYKVHESSVIGWLIDMDLKTASDRMATEFKAA